MGSPREQSYDIGPISAASPDMSDSEMTALRESIAKIGQQVPVLVWRGQVIDGRKRMAACAELGITPLMTHLAEDATPGDYATALNLLRTHYTTSQRAVFAERIATADKSTAVKTWRAKERGATGNSQFPPTIEEAAKAFGVEQSTVSAARRVRRTASPEIMKAVETGKLTLHAAEKIARTVPEAEQASVLEKVTEARGGRGRNSPISKVLDQDGRRDRAHPKPVNEQFARSVQMLTIAAEVITQHVEAAATDMRRKAFLETLRDVRTALTRAINSLEIAA